MKHLVPLIAAALIGQAAYAQSPEDVLIYKFSRTTSWQEHAAGPDRNGVVKGRNLLVGTNKVSEYWIFGRDNNTIARVEFYTLAYNGATEKLYDVFDGDFALLGTDSEAYVDDKVMDIMFLPTARAGVKMQTCRDSFALEEDSFGYVWDLTGTTKVLPGLNDVAPLLSGFYQSSSRSKDGSNDALVSFLSRVDVGPQSATFDARLTTRARTVSVNGRTANTLENGIETVIEVLEKLGYDYSE